MSCITAALNDPGRSIIGDPRRGTYAVSFTGKHLPELDELAESLEALAITWQTNTNRTHSKVFLAIYAYVDQERLLRAAEPFLEIDRLNALECLVLARGPVPEELVRKLQISIAAGRSYAYLADRLNELGIITGMGGIKWTAKKVKAAHRNA